LVDFCDMIFRCKYGMFPELIATGKSYKGIVDLERINISNLRNRCGQYLNIVYLRKCQLV